MMLCIIVHHSLGCVHWIAFINNSINNEFIHNSVASVEVFGLGNDHIQLSSPVKDALL